MSEPRNGIADKDKKREFMEQYGINPDDFLPKSSRKVNLSLDYHCVW